MGYIGVPSTYQTDLCGEKQSENKIKKHFLTSRGMVLVNGKFARSSLTPTRWPSSDKQYKEVLRELA